MKLDFIKMNGAGNDFIIFDSRNQVSVVGGQWSGELSPEQIRRLSSRNNEVTKGCDQLLILRESEKADIFMQIYNADGSEVDACGNATRCVVDMLYKELGKLPVSIQTNAAILQGVDKIKATNNTELETILLESPECILVNMGKPKFEWKDIPLAMPAEEAAKKIESLCGLKNSYFVNMGNPHVIFFEGLENKNTDNPDIDVVDGFLDELGERLENATDVFPERVNVSIAVPYHHQYAFGGYRFMASTWERGVGYTAACGTAACAILAAFQQIEPEIRKADVQFNNSNQIVMVSVTENGHILLGGAVETEFSGTIEI